ncbi:MAG: winged helix-turn-helix domain-containing protein [Asgard group archaeon]|nr:winged helix-turn-helix domain-containing protein [Asgard group archaeon]
MARTEDSSSQIASTKKTSTPSETEEELIYSALGSSIRREILVFIKEHGKVGFVELRERFDLKVGSLYHQLNSLEKLVSQDENKKYFLSSLGEIAYKILMTNKDKIEANYGETPPLQSFQETHPTLQKFLQALLFLFLPVKVFAYLKKEPIRTLFEGLLIIGGMMFFSYDSKQILAGFYPLEVEEGYFAIISISVLWIGMTLIVDLLKMLFHQKPFSPWKLFPLLPFCFLPILFVLFLIWLQTKVSTTFLFMDGYLLTNFAQIWALTLTITAVSQAEELTLKRSSLIVLLTFYVAYIFSFIFFI